MSAATIAVEVFLAVAVLSIWLCSIAIVVMPNFYERLHYLSTVTTISAFSILIAVVIEEGWGQATIKTILVCVVLVLINAVVTHATARAARVRTLGHWSSDPHQQIPGTDGLGGAAATRERKENE
ncbi:MAG: monovalent cation/H(+) antiporter subunit G [Acidobacteria bacterium]|nr:monovalent cation/H(+) antiporter subunit G [Acidobacteriota bacterium]